MFIHPLTKEVALFICRETSDTPCMCGTDGRHTTKGRRAPCTVTVHVSGFWIHRNLVSATAPAGLLCIRNPKQIQNATNILWTTSSGKSNCLWKRRCTAVTLVASLNSLVHINCFEIPRCEVLRKQKYYLLKLLYPQIFFASDFSFMAIATSNIFQLSWSFFYQIGLPQAEDMQYPDLLIAFTYLALF